MPNVSYKYLSISDKEIPTTQAYGTLEQYLRITKIRPASLVKKYGWPKTKEEAIAKIIESHRGSVTPVVEIDGKRLKKPIGDMAGHSAFAAVEKMFETEPLKSSPLNWQAFAKLTPRQQEQARKLVKATRALEVETFGKELDNTSPEKCSFQVLRGGNISKAHFLSK